jgi:short-subunit dehydrogenase
MTHDRPRTALITGASSGIGEAFARRLAAAGMRLFLTSRPADEHDLRVVANDLARTAGVEVGLYTGDLGQRGAAEQLQAAADHGGFEPDILVNNAGVMFTGPIAAAGMQEQLEMVRVNVEAVVALTALYLPRMVARRAGGIINVGSVAGLQPVPYSAVYAASKSFIHSFSESLWAETHGTGVKVVAICPGPVPTTGLRHDGGPEARSFRVMKRAGIVLRALGRRPLTLDMIVSSALAGLERDQPFVMRRTPGASLIHVPLSALRLATTRQAQLRTMERLFRPKPS